MTVARAVDLLVVAQHMRIAYGAFNVIQLEHAEAIISGAEDIELPVIIQISENAVRYHGGLAAIGTATLIMARDSELPIVVHLDHAEDEDLILEALDLGFKSIMYDGSKLPWEENLARTATITKVCHAAGASVEAELGEVGGKDGAHAPGVRTDPEQAALFVAATGVDSLAVAVGTSHAMADRSAVVDLELVAQLAAAVPVPLVMHGSSGVDDPGLQAAVKAGIRKVNIGTRLNQAMTRAVREQLAADPTLSDPRKYLGPARDAIEAEVAQILGLLSAPDKPPGWRMPPSEEHPSRRGER
jgi:fructose-bisphosphate aldolase, class II